MVVVIDSTTMIVTVIEEGIMTTTIATATGMASNSLCKCNKASSLEQQ